MNVTVYTTPACVMCNYTKVQLSKLGIEFVERDISTNSEWEAEAKALVAEHHLLNNYPVVVAGNHHRLVAWSGFKIDMIKGLRETGDY